MRRPTSVLAVAVVLVVAGCQGGAVERAWEAAEAAYDAAPAPQEKASAMQRFLARFPDTPHTQDAVDNFVYAVFRKLHRPADADAYLVELLARVRNSERRRAVAFERLQLLAALDRREELQVLAAELAAGRALTYREAMAMAEAATTAGAWELAERCYRDALPYATEEAYRAEHAGSPLRDELVARAARRRRAAVLVGLGWARANLGRLDEALAHFADARRFDLVRFLGNTDSKLGLYEGRTLHRAGRLDEALEVLAPEALFGQHEEARTALEEVYLARGGRADEFPAFLAAERQRRARPAVDFTLADYRGTPHRFLELGAGKVVLLAFWFPT